MARLGPGDTGGSSSDDSSDTQQSQAPQEDFGGTDSANADEQIVDRVRERRSPTSAGQDTQQDDQAPQENLGDAPGAGADERAVDRVREQRSVDPEPPEQQNPTRTDLGGTGSANADEQAVRRVKRQRSATAAPEQPDDTLSRIERGAGGVVAGAESYINDLQRRSREELSPAGASAFTKSNVEQARAGERELARRSREGDLIAQLFQTGENVQRASVDFGGGAGDAYNTFVDANLTFWDTVNPGVADVQRGIMGVNVGEATVREQTTGAVETLVAGPGVIAGGVLQANAASFSAQGQFIDSVSPAASGDFDTATQQFSDLLTGRGSETAQRLGETGAASLKAQGSYAASRPVEAGLVYAAPALAGGKRGIKADVARGRRAAGATKSGAEFMYRKAPNRFTDPVTRATGRTKFRARDVKAETRLKLSQQAETVQRYQDAMYRTKARGRARAREAKADLKFEAKQRAPDAAVEAPQRVQDSLFRIEQRQKARVREAKADARYAKDVASSEVSRRISRFGDNIQSRFGSGKNNGGYDTIVSRKNLKYEGESGKYPTWESESGMNPFRETNIPIEGTKGGKTSGKSSSGTASKSGGSSRGGISDVRRTRGNRGGTTQRTRGGGSRQQTILKQRRKSPPKKTNTGGGAETLINPSQTRSVKPP
ncbi:MAG: hypothetical protein ACNS61_05595, partial [Candidatus Wenzhouxiangella sp. M2_3B_020]